MLGCDAFSLRLSQKSFFSRVRAAVLDQLLWECNKSTSCECGGAETEEKPHKD